MKKSYSFSEKLIDMVLCHREPLPYVNSNPYQMDCQWGSRDLVMKQGKMIGYFVSDQQLTIISQIVFMAVMHFVQNTVQFVK
jgi:hypothetical protein